MWLATEWHHPCVRTPVERDGIVGFKQFRTIILPHIWCLCGPHIFLMPHKTDMPICTIFYQCCCWYCVAVAVVQHDFIDTTPHTHTRTTSIAIQCQNHLHPLPLSISSVSLVWLLGLFTAHELNWPATSWPTDATSSLVTTWLAAAKLGQLVLGRSVCCEHSRCSEL